MTTRQSKIDSILAAMQDAYDAEGIDGDFDDARRYYREDASDAEIDADLAKWAPDLQPNA